MNKTPITDNIIESACVRDVNIVTLLTDHARKLEEENAYLQRHIANDVVKMQTPRKVRVFEMVRGGDRVWEKRFAYDGTFHLFGTNSIEQADGFPYVQDTIAVVEKEDGSVCTVDPDMIQFIL